MSNNVAANPVMVWLLIGGILISPAFVRAGTTTLSKTSSGVLHNTSFSIEVQDVANSESGYKYCTFFAKSVEKTYIGSCKTTDQVELIVGSTYEVSRANIDGDTININKARKLTGGPKLTVIRIVNKVGTRLAELSNGNVIGGNNLNEGDEVTID
jgi:hypothetical protein